ncbi:hypothetical protein [Aeromicrobium sp. 179-A 4D2 NHS]|uniref:hypothetical protein n=1 Tax=Aeromicrobium sp. 179-A 4D2 NHS TaxID=3142375 RepID=UPI0039A3CEF1
MLSKYKHRKMLLAKGADPDVLSRWEAIDPDVATLLLSAGLSLDTYKAFKDKGLTEYQYFNDAIIRNLSIDEIVAEKHAAEKRARDVEQAAKDETARILRAATGSWDDTPKPGQPEHWYFTPEVIAEFRARPIDDPRLDLVDYFAAALYTTFGWFFTSTLVAAMFGSSLHAVVCVLLGIPIAAFTAGASLTLTRRERQKPPFTLSNGSMPSLLRTNMEAWSDESRDESWGYRTGFSRARDEARRNQKSVEYTWVKVVRPAVEAGAHPSNIDRWLSLSAEVRDNALTNRVGINMAERIDARLATRVVTPLVFIETLEELESEDRLRSEQPFLRVLPQLVADATSSRSVIGSIARRLLA